VCMSASISGDDFLPVLIEARHAVPGSTLADHYPVWKDAFCRAMKWSPEEFEERLDRAEANGY